MTWREVLREAKERQIMCVKDASFVQAINPSKPVYCCHLRTERTGKKIDPGQLQGQYLLMHSMNGKPGSTH